MADGCRYNHIVVKVIVLLLPLKTKRHVSTNWYFCDDWHTHNPGTPNLPYKLIDYCIERWSLCLDAVPFLHSQKSLRWRHNGHDDVSNLQPHHYLLNRLFGCRSQRTSNFALYSLCERNSPSACVNQRLLLNCVVYVDFKLATGNPYHVQINIQLPTKVCYNTNRVSYMMYVLPLWNYQKFINRSRWKNIKAQYDVPY